jgi:transposase
MTYPFDLEPETQLENRRLNPLQAMLKQLPMGQRLVAYALIAGDGAPTYRQLAALLGVHCGTVYQHLRRIRLRRPHIYAAVMAHRARQLGERHVRALERAAVHSLKWHCAKARRVGLRDESDSD